VQRTERPGPGTEVEAAAGERYLLLADISGYTSFMAGVEREHGADFSAGVPAAYSILAALLDSVIHGIAPEFTLVKLEGDAVFAAAPASNLDGMGDQVLEKLGATYVAFTDARTRAIPSSDHVCTACPRVAILDLKAILHRGPAVRQTVGSGSDLLGPSVTVAHRLLKNSIRERIDGRPYLFLTDAAATGLGASEVGIEHHEEYADVGRVDGRIVELG
jgi:class 3 adenylate cyclase